jgi:alkanesulfonate monooxygenase SsuD/methylene tetrahydromethanopterin reductase-like flavin-dependent oxidoreductase (luciferase family)
MPPIMTQGRKHCRQLTNWLRPVHKASVELSLYTDLRPAPGADLRRHYLQVVEEVELAERLGFHGVWTTEQHGVDDGYLPAQLPTLAAFAMRTSRLRLATGVVLLPLAQPRRVVEEACVVDVLSGGRLTLGVGAGNYAHEFRAFGVPRERRGRILEEAIRFVRPGLAGEALPDGLPVNVPPVQRPIPLVVGGLAEPAVDRAARLADGHFAYAFMDPVKELGLLWERRLSPALERHARPRSGYRLIAAVVLWASDTFELDWRRHVGPAFLYQQRRYRDWDAGLERAEGYLEDAGADPAALIPRMLVGPPAEIAERLRALRAAYPLDELVFWYRLPGVPHELAIQHLEQVAERVLPAVRDVP